MAVRYGVIDCSDARRGALRGDKFKEVLQIAREKGIIKTEQQMITTDIRRIEIDE